MERLPLSALGDGAGSISSAGAGSGEGGGSEGGDSAGSIGANVTSSPPT